ncbi:MAG: hypothetical protein OEY34_00645 [Cyclobacteriaceae bacterium]|nr:hypothetical protein [Cyclobacteriaceae bacterium]
MKLNTIILILALIVSMKAFSQDEPETNDNSKEIKTLFSKETKVTGFGAFDLTFSSMYGRNVLLTGGHGGILFNKTFFLGIGGTGIATPIEFDGADPAKVLRLNGGYGGLMMGYSFAPQEIFHVNIRTLFAAGGMEVTDPEFTWNGVDPYNLIENSVFFAVEPYVEAEVNVTRFFRIGLGVSYRYTSGLKLDRNAIYDADISGISGNMSFKFGGF